MALLDFSAISSQARGFSNLSLVRQLGMMIGLSVSVAVGVGTVFWAQTPDYRMLYNNLDPKDAVEVSSALQSSNIQFKVSETTGSIMVPSDDVYNARMQLAAQGLPRGVGGGYELLEQDSTFGVSQFMENVRYQRALEGELARTIMSINAVRSARVHLALPKKSAFIRNRKNATASVTIDMYPGRNLDGSQVSSISHMVAASIPDLDENEVTIIDQKGRLLKTPGGSKEMQLTSSQFEYRKNLEEYYIKRIEDILTPIVGVNAVRAQVSADIDFTITEQTQETFNPDLPAIRSEQLLEEKNSVNVTSGVPGAVSNQVPDESIALNSEEARAKTPSNSMRRSVRNYELDKTISHTRVGGHSVQRLSIAVVIDDEISVDDAGEVTRKPVTSEKLEHLTELVKEAVGFDARRGDSVNVINATFTSPQTQEPLPEPSFFDDPNTMGLVRQVGAAAIIIMLLLGVLKPILKELASRGREAPRVSVGRGQKALPHDEMLMMPSQGEGEAGRSYEENIATAKNLATQDPKRVAQVVNSWVTSE